jgi:hypothetical protein
LGYSLRGFAVKVELLSSSDAHIRYVPAAMVNAGHAEIAHQNGKVRSIGLIATAATHARMIGPPSDGRALGVRFTRWVRLHVMGAPRRIGDARHRASSPLARLRVNAFPA